MKRAERNGVCKRCRVIKTHEKEEINPKMSPLACENPVAES